MLSAPQILFPTSVSKPPALGEHYIFDVMENHNQIVIKKPILRKLIRVISEQRDKSRGRYKTKQQSTATMEI